MAAEISTFQNISCHIFHGINITIGTQKNNTQINKHNGLAPICGVVLRESIQLVWNKFYLE